MKLITRYLRSMAFAAAMADEVKGLCRAPEWHGVVGPVWHVSRGDGETVARSQDAVRSGLGLCKASYIVAIPTAIGEFRELLSYPMSQDMREASLGDLGAVPVGQ